MNVTHEEVSALSTVGALNGLFPIYAPAVRENEDGSTVAEDHGDLTFGEGAPSNAVQKTTAALAKLRAGTLDVMAPLRQAAFETAMRTGNAITNQITGTYADAEARSWTVQEMEADVVISGGTLPDDAILPALANDKGVPLLAYAQSVKQKAIGFRQIAVAAVRLRRGAEGLLSTDLDTEAKLGAAVEALRAEAAKAAAAAGLTL